MRTTILATALLVAGCGGSDKTFTVSGHALTVRDEGYFFTDSRFDYCQGGGAGQLVLDFVDYAYICDPKHPPALDPALARNEMRLILTTGPSPDYSTHYPTSKMPYQAAPADCVTGGNDAIAQFVHYGGGGAQPEIITGTGTITINQFDPMRQKSIIGTFDLRFGADQLKDSFTLDSCN